MAIQLVIDSASDFNNQEAKKLKLHLLPMKVLFGDREYRDGTEMTHHQFFERLIESDTLPSTSQIAPYEYDQVFKPIIEAGDSAVVITISSKLSGTYQSAVIAATAYPGRVFVVDSLNACIGEQLLIRYALPLLSQNLTAAELAAQLDQAKTKIRLLALLDTLEYLKKGGRISAAAALAGNLLSIKPVVAVVDGAVTLLGKARGSKQGNNLLALLIESSGGIDFTLPYLLAYSGLEDTLLQKYIADSATFWQPHTNSLPICTIGSTIGTHVGPGAVAVAFFGKNDSNN